MNIFTTPNVLFWFKIGGAVLVGLGAGIKVFKEIVKKRNEKQRITPIVDVDYPDSVVLPRTEEKPNNLFWETIELTFIISGLGVNLAATAIDQRQTAARNEAANAQTAKQLWNAEESLNYLERLGTRFETLSFSVTFRLSPYRDYRPPDELLRELFPDLPYKAQIGRTFSEDIFGKTNVLHLDLDLSTDDLDAYLASLSGHSIDNDVLGLKFIYIPQVYLNLVAANSPRRYLHHSGDFSRFPMFRFTKVHRAGVEVFEPYPAHYTGYKGPMPMNVIKPMRARPGYDMPNFKDLYFAKAASTEGDMFVLATNCNRIAHFTFNPASKELLVQLDFDCPKAGWEQTEWMTSLPDLGNAILFLGVTNVPQNRPNRVVPVSGKFTFGRTTITITNFFPCRPQNWHGCELPGKREILDMR